MSAQISVSTPPPTWTGRVDGTTAEHLRWHQVVTAFDAESEPGACLFIGFASDEGVHRNKGRRGAAAGPDVLRAALASMALADPIRAYDAGTVAVTGSRLGLRSGDEVQVREAVEAMLVASANDACLAVAESLSGSGAAFASRMNRRAAEMGLTGTRFVDPCGHDAPGQHTTARDLWKLARVALGNPEFRRLVALPEVRLETRAGRVLQAGTSNALLGRLPGADGVKTGFTPEAGKCVVVHAVRGDRDVTLVLLGAPDRWWTAAALVERAFAETPPSE